MIENELLEKMREERKASLSSIPSDLGIVPRKQSRLISMSDMGREIEELPSARPVPSLVVAIEKAGNEEREESKLYDLCLEDFTDRQDFAIKKEEQTD